MDGFIAFWLLGWNVMLGSMAIHLWRVRYTFESVQSRILTSRYMKGEGGDGELTLELMSGAFTGQISRVRLPESVSIHDYPLQSMLEVRVDPRKPERSELPKPFSLVVVIALLWIVPNVVALCAALAD